MKARTHAFIVLSVGMIFAMTICLAFTPSAAASVRATVPPTNTLRAVSLSAMVPTLVCPPERAYQFVDSAGVAWVVSMRAVCR